MWSLPSNIQTRHTVITNKLGQTYLLSQHAKTIGIQAVYLLSQHAKTIGIQAVC